MDFFLGMISLRPWHRRKRQAIPVYLGVYGRRIEHRWRRTSPTSLRVAPAFNILVAAVCGICVPPTLPASPARFAA